MQFFTDAQFTEKLVEIFKTFLFFSGLKPNLTKHEIVGLETLKQVQVAVCRMRSTDPCNEAIKNLSTHFSNNNRRVQFPKNRFQRGKCVKTVSKPHS